MAESDDNARKRSLKRTIAMTRSGLRRYPRALRESLRQADSVVLEGVALEEVSQLRYGASWLGHAGVLLRQGGRTLIADPVLSHRIGLRVGPWVFGPKRLAPAPVEPDDLPTPDVIVITHAHFDHLDRPTLEQLASSKTTVVTARKTRRLVPRGFGHVIELDWDEEREIEDLQIRALRPSHWGARMALDRRRGFNSYLVTSDGHRSLLAGDTAMTNAFGELAEMPPDLAAFGIGAYDPWEHHHATPEQVWEMFSQCGARWLLPIHHGTFELSDEHPDEPLERLLGAAGDAAADRIALVSPGELWYPGEGAGPD